MITQMEVFTPGVTAPPIPIVNQPEALDSIQITEIDGLGPVTASVSTTQYGSIDGEILNGTNTPKRNIVISAKLNPNYAAGETMEGLRQILYAYFMPENSLRLRFTSTHIATVEISGVVESCDPDLFSQDPVWKISIICPQPYFTAVGAQSIQGMTQGFSSPTDVLINYEGNADVGVLLDLTMVTGGTAFTGEARFINNTPTTKIAILSSISLGSTSRFQLSSVQGNKYARQYPIPSGAYTNLMGRVTPGSNWITLRKGINRIQVLTATAGQNWSISYYAKYGGL